MVLQQVVQVECYPVKREYIVIKGMQRDNVGMGILPVVQMESVGVEVLLLGCVRALEGPRNRGIFVLVDHIMRIATQEAIRFPPISDCSRPTPLFVWTILHRFNICLGPPTWWHSLMSRESNQVHRFFTFSCHHHFRIEIKTWVINQIAKHQLLLTYILYYPYLTTLMVISSWPPKAARSVKFPCGVDFVFWEILWHMYLLVKMESLNIVIYCILPGILFH